MLRSLNPRPGHPPSKKTAARCRKASPASRSARVGKRQRQEVPRVQLRVRSIDANVSTVPPAGRLAEEHGRGKAGTVIRRGACPIDRKFLIRRISSGKECCYA